MFRYDLIHLRLCEGRFIDFIVSVLAITYQINNNISFVFKTVFTGYFTCFYLCVVCVCVMCVCDVCVCVCVVCDVCGVCVCV